MFPHYIYTNKQWKNQSKCHFHDLIYDQTEIIQMKTQQIRCLVYKPYISTLEIAYENNKNIPNFRTFYKFNQKIDKPSQYEIKKIFGQILHFKYLFILKSI